MPNFLTINNLIVISISSIAKELQVSKQAIHQYCKVNKINKLSAKLLNLSDLSTSYITLRDYETLVTYYQHKDDIKKIRRIAKNGNCKFCSSLEVVKFGFDRKKEKQLYYCKQCKKVFRKN
jgi:hypothetical protein